MRINEAAGSRGTGRSAPGEAGFGDALRRARDGRPAREGGARPEARAEPRRPHPRSSTGAAPGDAPREEGRAVPVADARGSTADADPPPVPELAALVRALPSAVVAAGSRNGAPLALSFGRSLEVELRSGASGIELLLRPDRRLLRAAEAELPRLLAALRVRGIAVARAEVRALGGSSGRAR